MNRILIVGSGIVGKATGLLLQLNKYNDISFFDTSIEVLDELSVNNKQIINKFEFNYDQIYFCLPTLSDNHQPYDLTIFEKYFQNICANAKSNFPLIIIRSTIAPGDTHKFIEIFPELKNNIIYFPEFLREKNALFDVLNPKKIIIGVSSEINKKKMNEVFTDNYLELIEFTDFQTAEFIKILHNAYNASKISFWNQAFLLMNSIGVNSNLVSEVVSETCEGSWNIKYGINGGTPFSGKCLPKDLDALIKWSKLNNLYNDFLLSIKKINDLI